MAGPDPRRPAVLAALLVTAALCAVQVVTARAARAAAVPVVTVVGVASGLAVSWQAGAGEVVTAGQAEAWQGSSRAGVCSGTGSGAGCTVAGLTDGQPYTVRARLRVAGAWSPWSSWQAGTAGVPPAPSPTPTVTVTAAPVPAPTVTVTSAPAVQQVELVDAQAAPVVGGIAALCFAGYGVLVLGFRRQR